MSTKPAARRYVAPLIAVLLAFWLLVLMGQALTPAPPPVQADPFYLYSLMNGLQPLMMVISHSLMNGLHDLHSLDNSLDNYIKTSPHIRGLIFGIVGWWACSYVIRPVIKGIISDAIVDALDKRARTPKAPR